MSARLLFQATIPAATLQSGLAPSGSYWIGRDGTLTLSGGSVGTVPPPANAVITDASDCHALTIAYDSPTTQTGLTGGFVTLANTTLGAVPPTGRMWPGLGFPGRVQWLAASTQGQQSMNWGAAASGGGNAAPGEAITPVTGLLIEATTWPTTASNLTVQLWGQSHRLGAVFAGQEPSVPVLGPNLLQNPNGPYGSGPWALTNLTEITNQPGPFGTNTASLLTDNAVNGSHDFTQFIAYPAAPAKLHITVYVKFGTFPGSFEYTDGATTSVGISNAGVPSIIFGAPFNMTSTLVGGFYKVEFDQVGTGSQFHMIFLNPGSPYIGSGQNLTVGGLALQRYI
jgi:hypothetical protein